MNLEINKIYSNFKLINKIPIKEYNSILYRFEHIKTGAKLFFMKNKDNNKVFSISFNTIPSDDSGVAHILEHSVLCGSKKYPLKDPFAEILKSSITTFLNAFTFPDKTLYPFGTTNEKEFNKLMDIYLDAVFNPEVLRNENIFLQEGHRIELFNKKDELKYNGVVYNEMKGVFSNPINLIINKSFNSLFPNNPYKYESGGIPNAIIKLSYQELINFHNKFYTPSNSICFLYGNLNIIEKLELIDKNYFSNKELNNRNSNSNFNINSNNNSNNNNSNNNNNNYLKPNIELHEPIRKDNIIIQYPENKIKDRYLFSKNYVISNSSNTLEILGFEILNKILFELESSPLRNKLMESKLGENVFSIMNLESRQPVYSIILQNTNLDKKELFENILNKELEKLSKGIDSNLKQSAFNKRAFELKENESEFGAIGIDLFIKILSIIQYENEIKEEDYIKSINYSNDLNYIKENLNNGFLENLIKKYLLNNDHQSFLILEPSKDLNPELEIKKELEKIKNNLSEEELELLIKKSNEVLRFQLKKDGEEIKNKIKVLDLNELNKNPKLFEFKEIELNNTKILYHNEESKDISYLNFLFKINSISFSDLQYLNLLKDLLFESKTKDYDFQEFSNLINLYLGNLDFKINIIEKNKSNSKNIELYFNIELKYLNQNFDKIKLILEELFNRIIFDENKIIEILSRIKSNLETAIISSGHKYSSYLVKSTLSQKGFIENKLFGFEYYNFINNLFNKIIKSKNNNETNEINILINKLNEIYSNLFNSNSLIISLSSKYEFYGDNINLIKEIKSNLNQIKSDSNLFNKELIEFFKKNQIPKNKKAILSNSDVNYVSIGSNFKDLGLEYIGTLEIIKVYLRYKYLWELVRVKNGAYGALVRIDTSGEIIFSSYRDPNIEKTIEVYNEFKKHLKNLELNEIDFKKLIISSIGNLDKPLDLDLELYINTINYIKGIDFEFKKKIRSEIINSNIESLKKLSKYFDFNKFENSIAVIGNRTQINNSKIKFKDIFEL